MSKSVPPAVEKHDALFRVLAQKSIACLKIKAASQPPATSTRTQPSRQSRYNANHQLPRPISLNSTTRYLTILPGDDEDDCWWALEEKRDREEHTTNKYSKQTSHQTYSTRRNHTNEISGPVLLKHDTKDLSRPTDHEFTTLIIARSMLPCTIEFS